MIRLENWRYMTQMGCMQDSWRLHGEVFGHPNYPDGKDVVVSTPKSLNRDEMTVTTCSGRTYHLGNCEGVVEEQLKHIQEDVERGGTFTW